MRRRNEKRKPRVRVRVGARRGHGARDESPEGVRLQALCQAIVDEEHGAHVPDTGGPAVRPALAERVLAARSARAAVISPSSTRSVAPASRCRSTTARSSAHRPASSWCIGARDRRARRPTSGTWTGSPSEDLERVACEVASAVRGDEAKPRPLRAGEPPPARRSSVRPEEVAAERRRVAGRVRRTRARRRGRDRPGHGRLQRAPARGAGRELGRPRDRRRPHARAPRRAGRGAQRRPRRGRRGVACGTRGIRAFRRRSRLGRRRGGAPCADDAGGAAGARRAGCRWWSGTASAACSSTRRPGHGLESDAVQKQASVYAGRLGERLAGSL